MLKQTADYDITDNVFTLFFEDDNGASFSLRLPFHETLPVEASGQLVALVEEDSVTFLDTERHCCNVLAWVEFPCEVEGQIILGYENAETN